PEITSHHVTALCRLDLRHETRERITSRSSQPYAAWTYGTPRLPTLIQGVLTSPVSGTVSSELFVTHHANLLSASSVRERLFQVLIRHLPSPNRSSRMVGARPAQRAWTGRLGLASRPRSA